MKYIITEEQFDRIKKLLVKFIETMSIPDVCGFWVDDETEEDGTPWIYFILDSSAINGTHQILILNKIKKNIKDEIENMFGIRVMVSIIVKNCSDIKQ